MNKSMKKLLETLFADQGRMIITCGLTIHADDKRSLAAARELEDMGIVVIEKADTPYRAFEVTSIAMLRLQERFKNSS